MHLHLYNYDVYLNDKGRYGLLLCICLAFGYLIAGGTVLFIRPRGARLQFFKEKGFEMAMFIMAAFMSAVLVGLFSGGAVTMLFGGSRLTADERFMIAGICAAASFVAAVIYAAIHVMKS